MRTGYCRTIVEPSLTLSYTVAGIQFTPTGYFDLSRRGATIELPAAVALPIKEFGTELDLGASVGHYDLHDAVSNIGPGIRLSGDYCSVSAIVPYQISAAGKITVGLIYAATLHSSLQQGASRRANPLATRRGVIQIGYSHSL